MERRMLVKLWTHHLWDSRAELDLEGSVRTGRIREGGKESRVPWEGSLDSPKQLQPTEGARVDVSLMIRRSWWCFRRGRRTAGGFAATGGEGACGQSTSGPPKKGDAIPGLA